LDWWTPEQFGMAKRVFWLARHLVEEISNLL